MTCKSLLFGLILVALVMAACGGNATREAKSPERNAPGVAAKEAPPQKPTTVPQGQSADAPRGGSVKGKASGEPATAAVPPQEKPKLIPSDITEEEQSLFEKYGSVYAAPIDVNLPPEEVNKFIEIWLKLENPYQIRWFTENAETAEIAWAFYDGDMGSVLHYLLSDQSCQKNRDCFALILRVYDKAKGKHKETLKIIAMAMKRFEFEREKRVAILRDLAKDPDQDVRLETAASFLKMGLADEGLPLLEQLAKEGRTYALPYLFKSGWGNGPWEFWDKRGLDILKMALDFPIDEIRAEAAIFLGEIKVDQERAERVAFEVLTKYKDMTAANFGVPNSDMPPSRAVDSELWRKHELDLSAGRACDYSMQALAILRSKRAIPILKEIKSKNNEWYFTCNDYTASQALGKYPKEETR